jgi:S1-C subfamily serine protease
MKNPLLFILPCLLLSLPALAVEPEKVREIYDQAKPSLVVVQYTFESELGRRELKGAGVVVSERGLVALSMALTPMGLPDEQLTEFKIILPGDDEIEIDAEFQGRDERTGLSFLLAKPGDEDAAPHAWQPLAFHDKPVQIGQPVVSVGLLPEAAGHATYVSAPMVSAILRGPVPQVLVGNDGLTVIGSPVFDLDGTAVGMVLAQQDHSPFLNDPRDPMSGVNLPPRMFVPARDFLLGLTSPPVAGEPLKLPNLGVAQLSGLKKEVAEYYGIKGQPAVQIGDVIPERPAAKAGLRSGDIIVTYDGKALERGDQPDEAAQILGRAIIRRDVGDTVTFGVLRGPSAKLQEIAVTLEERPKPSNRAARFWAEDLGFTSRELVFEDTYSRRLPSDTTGVIVALIRPSSAAQTGKLQTGDLITRINQTQVESLEQFRQSYEEFRKDSPRDAVVLEVLRAGQTQIIRIEPPQ